MEDECTLRSIAAGEVHEREHRRRNALQAQALSRRFDRQRHAAFIESALSRANADEPEPSHEEPSHS